jgi:DNA-directed RNA polymerase subunit alpha
MSTLTCIETYLDKEKNYFGSFIIEPLETGQGVTLGNALRRTLLSDLSGFAITGLRINNLKHEFSSIEGVREDVLEIMLNFKDVIFKNTFISKNKHYELKQKGYLHVKGPVIVTAGMLKLPRSLLKVINPQQYICTIVDDSELYIEIDIEKGKGYRLAEENRKNKIEKKLSSIKPSTLFIDSMFIPIKRVNYKIKLIHDTKGNIKESLNFEILTNGSITPKRSLQESLKVLLNLFYPLFLNPNFFEISDKVIKKLE